MSHPSTPLPPKPELNLWTIGSIAIVAYCLANVLHEGLGHGGACFLLKGKPLQLNAIFFSYDVPSVSRPASRAIASAGSIVNLLTGGIALAWFRFSAPRADALRYFLWLFSTVSVLMAFGYFLFSGVIGVGDWVTVFDRLAPPLVVRGGLTLVGGVLYILVAPRLLLPALDRFLDRTLPLEPQMKRLTLFPYLVGGATFFVAGLLNPYGLKLVLISALAASFGGTALLARCKIPQPHAAATGTPGGIVLGFHRGWIAAAAIMLAIFVGVLGPGIKF